MNLDIEYFFGSKYSHIDWFYNERSIVTNQKGLKGTIDRNGKEVIPCIYSKICSFNKYGLAAAQLANSEKWGIIDKNGNVVLPFEYDNIDSNNSDVYFSAQKRYDEPEILDPADCHLITKGKVKKIDKNVYEFGRHIYDVRRGNLFKDSFVHFKKYGNIYLGKESINMALYDPDLNYLGSFNWAQSQKAGNNIILKTIRSNNELEYALLNIESGKYIPPRGNIGYTISYSAGVEVYIYHIEDDKKSTFFVNNNNQLITLPDVHAQHIWPSIDNNGRTVLYVEEQKYIGIYAEDGTIIIPCKYRNITLKGNCYIVETDNDKYGIIGLDGTVLIEPEYKSIRYLGENRYYVTDDDGKNFLVDENGTFKSDFSSPGVKIQDQEIISDSFEERNAWERKTLMSIYEQGQKEIERINAQSAEKIEQIKTQSAEEIEQIVSDNKEITEYLSGPSHTSPKKQ